MLSHEQDDDKTVIIVLEVKENIKWDIKHYRVKLQREIGRSTVGSVSLSSRFPIELMSLVLQHLPELTSVERVEQALPVNSKEISSYRIILYHPEASYKRLVIC